ncbi:MAG: HEAT repeat domain-containing protein [Actinomycetota bacterium]|nr:HEAT repeat domain-containing protein [Actinomycetota bacterium]
MAERHLHAAPPPDTETAERRRAAITAGHSADPETALRLLDDPEPVVRAAALGALARLAALADEALDASLDDPAPEVRRRALELCVEADRSATALLNDPDPTVVEVACWVAGERSGEGERSVDPLARIATTHDDPLCREAAVAALGAIGHPDGRDAVLAGLEDKAPIRRRAVLALAPFEGPEVVAALECALEDRDWQVRQAAEDLMRLIGHTG